MKHLCFQFRNIRVVDLCSDRLVQSRFFCRVKRHRLHRRVIFDRLDIVHDPLIMRRCDLRAVLPVYFVSVILRWIVTCGDIDPGDTAKLSHGIRKFRRRSQRFKHIGFDPVCRQTKRRLVCKFRRHPAGIISDCHAFLCVAAFVDIIGKSLRCFPHRVNVHPVRSCSDDPAKTGRSKLKVCIKTLFDLVLVIFDTL